MELQRRVFLGATVYQDSDGLFIHNVLQSPFLKKGDQIVSLNGFILYDKEQLHRQMKSYTIKDKIQIIIIRNNQKCTIDNHPLFLYPKEENGEFSVDYLFFTHEGLKIRLIITLKEEKQKNIVLLLQGIECSSIEHPLSNEHVYTKILYSFTKAGITTARVELFGNGDSEGSACSSYNFFDIVQLYQSAVEHLGFWGYKIILFGYSIGGVIAPMLANKNLNNVSGVICFDTLSSEFKLYLLKNKMRQALIRKEDKKSIIEEINLFQTFLSKLITENQSIKKLLQENKLFYKFVSKDFLFLGHNELYIQQLASIDYKDEWKKVEQPVLFVIGKNDCAIDFKEQDQLYEFVASQKKCECYKLVRNIDHFFRSKKGEFDIEAIKSLIQFILHLKNT